MNTTHPLRVVGPDGTRDLEHNADGWDRLEVVRRRLGRGQDRGRTP